ncbi:MAG: hypothetical protein MI921_01080 [Cytophagales bacterium]|nr:hypothetical protein [Cytophagales bacterium]
MVNNIDEFAFIFKNNQEQKEGPFIEPTGKKHKLPDIFDPGWEVAIDKKARALCSPLRDSRDLVGYFTAI